MVPAGRGPPEGEAVDALRRGGPAVARIRPAHPRLRRLLRRGVRPFLHHVPDPAATTTTAARDRDAALLATFHLAQQDEGCPPNQLPLLFRIDQQLAIPGGRYYVARCGGHDDCHATRGTLCMQHLQGLAPPRRGYWDPDRWLDKDMPAPGGSGCGV